MKFFSILTLVLTIVSSVKSMQCHIRGKNGVDKYNNGEEFRSENKEYMYKCIADEYDWDTKIVACLTKGKQKIKQNTSIVEDGIKYVCRLEDGYLMLLKLPLETNNKETMCETEKYGNILKHRNGEEFDSDDGVFINKCVVKGDNDWGITGVGCYSPNRQRIAVESSVKEGRYTYHCATENRKLHRSKSLNSPQRCKFSHNGKEYSYQNGEEFLFNNQFYYKCVIHSNGKSYIPTACYTAEKTKILIGKTAQEGEKFYECMGENGNIELKWKHRPTPKTKCTLTDNGKTSTYQNGEEFLFNNTFFYKCVIKDGDVSFDPTGCYTPGKTKILVGKTAQIGDDFYECISENGGIKLKRQYREGPKTKCTVDNKGKTSTYNNGEEFLYHASSISIYYRCIIKDGKVSYSPVACYDTDSQRKIPIGESVTKGGTTYKCTKENGSIRLERTHDLKCETTENGQTKKYGDGDEFNSGNYVYSCKIKNGETTTVRIACRSDKKQRIEIDASVKEGELTYKCKEENGQVTLSKIYKLKCEINDEHGQPQKYDDSDEFDFGKYIYKCIIKDGRASVERVACRSDKKQRIEVGSSVKEGEYTYKCVKENGHVKLVTSYPMKCEVNGKSYKHGEVIDGGNKMYIFKCNIANGQYRTIVSGCRTDNGKSIEIGGKVQEGEFTYTCERSNRGSILRSRYYT